MSNIYIQEPPTSGKVLLQTTVGDIDIELWAKEAPKACRNFVQLCLEGYYNGTIFHRLVKGFIVQGGDPNGDGTGGESIYGQPFKDEFHSRLRFVRRGLVAMANSGKDDNGSQFFFTLDATPELQNKNTIFGKVTGNTLYNMLKLEETLVDHDDRPLYSHKITMTRILNNPFPDIVPRITVLPDAVKTPSEKPKEKGKKNFKLLSFGEEAEEDEAEVNAVNEVYKGHSKSSHDLTNDPKLSSVPAISLYEDEKTKREADEKTLENVRKKLKKSDSNKQESVSSTEEIRTHKNSLNESDDEKVVGREEIRKQIKDLKKELNKSKHSKLQEVKEITEERNIEVEENEVLSKYHSELFLYEEKKKNLIMAKGTSNREQQTLKFLKKFEEKLHSAKEHSKEEEKILATDGNEDWLVHRFQADNEPPVIAKDANLPSIDRYDITDPRNAITKRRRDKNDHK